jgi:hypothetical protein
MHKRRLANWLEDVHEQRSANSPSRGQRGRGGVALYERTFGAIPDGKHPAEDGKRLMHAHLKLVGGAIFFA